MGDSGSRQSVGRTGADVNPHTPAVETTGQFVATTSGRPGGTTTQGTRPS
jgi:hypothetical protein